MINVFSSRTFEGFLSAYVESLSHRGRGEVTRIATALGVSTSLVSQVLSGQKLFTPEQGQALGEYMQLNDLEQEYVSYLLQRDRAGSKSLKDFWNSKLDRIREQSKKVANRVVSDRSLSEVDRAAFYSSPLYSAIRLYTTTGEHGKTVDEITKRFELPRPKVLEILSFLVQTGLCRHEKGYYSMGVQKTHLEEGSSQLLRHHANWRLRAIRESESLSKEELMYTAPVSLSKEDFELLREKMLVFIGDFLKQVHASPAEEIACFNMDFFWIRK